MRAALLLLAVSLSACQSAPQTRADVSAPTVDRQELAISAQTLTDLSLTLTGAVTGTAEPITIDKAVFELVVDGAVVSSGERPLKLSVAAGGSAEFSLTEGATTVKDEAGLKEVDARGGAWLVALRGHLVARFGDGHTSDLEFARSKEIRTPRLPHLKLTEFEGGRFSETEVQIVYHLGVVNPNPFPISIQGLDYAISIANKQSAKGTIGTGEKISPASTGVFDVTALVNEETHGKDVKKLIKGLVLPFTLDGSLRAALYTEPLATKGEVRLTPPR